MSSLAFRERHTRAITDEQRAVLLAFSRWFLRLVPGSGIRDVELLEAFKAGAAWQLEHQVGDPGDPGEKPI